MLLPGASCFSRHYHRQHPDRTSVRFQGTPAAVAAVRCSVFALCTSWHHSNPERTNVLRQSICFQACVIQEKALLTGCTDLTQVLPIAPWTVLLPCATFWLFILCWQRIRSAAGFPVVVFLDKLCIAQHDEALKEKARQQVYHIVQTCTSMALVLTFSTVRRQERSRLLGSSTLQTSTYPHLLGRAYWVWQLSSIARMS